MARPEEEFVISDDAIEPEDRDIETPAADAVEQATLANPAENEVEEVHRGMEVNEWDAVEQARVVDLDDDYR